MGGSPLFQLLLIRKRCELPSLVDNSLLSIANYKLPLSHSPCFLPCSKSLVSFLTVQFSVGQTLPSFAFLQVFYFSNVFNVVSQG